MRVGIDFDNTIINYDSLFHDLAVRDGSIGREVPAEKQSIRDAVRHLPNGEIVWQRLQAIAYGPRIGEASLMPGIERFLMCCKRHGSEVMVISHKTQFAMQDREHNCDLVEAAVTWLRARGLLGPGRPVSENSIFFEPTRAEKVARIATLDCDVFVDDLEETFREPGFPARTRRILFDRAGHGFELEGLAVFDSWDSITAALLC